MKKTPLSAVLFLAILAVLQATPAGAIPPAKTWVSTTGVDNATCGAITTPCRTLQQAHDNVAASGQVGVLNPGDYGRLPNISKSVTMANDGVGEATVTGLNGSFAVGVFGGAGDVITLRGLVIDGQVTASSGIAFSSGSALHIQNCVIRNFEFNAQGFGIG